MSSQQSILKFFKRTSAEVPVVGKRKNTDTGSSINKCLGYAGSVNVAPGTVLNQSAISRKLPDSVKILVHDMGPEWRTLLMNVIGSVSFTKLADFLGKERESYTIYPPQEEVFTWSRLTPPCNVRVVILGQDPYHGPKQAHGLAFSVKRPQPPPPSLANMYKEIASDPAFSVPKDWPPTHGDLTGWAKQGVLLLNAVLTVRASQPNSHKDKGWEMLTSSVINYINLHCSHVVFLLWGASARVQGTKIDLTKHLVLHAPHPSPLSANRGFFGCQHFSKANAYLKKHDLEPIDWTNV